MGTDNLLNRRKNERQKRLSKERKLREETWLIVCEGTKTEPNYFSSLINEINKKGQINKAELKTFITLLNPVTSRDSAILSITDNFLTAIKSSSVRYSLYLTHSLRLKLSGFLPKVTNPAIIISLWPTP